MYRVNIEGIYERPVAECTATGVADALTRSFGGYVMPRSSYLAATGATVGAHA